MLGEVFSVLEIPSHLLQDPALESSKSCNEVTLQSKQTSPKQDNQTPKVVQNCHKVSSWGGGEHPTSHHLPEPTHRISSIRSQIPPLCRGKSCLRA